MTGERLGWFRVASHLKIPVGELRGRVTFTEFLEWLEFLRKEEQRHSKEDFYLAQIAAEVRRPNTKSPSKIKVVDFLLKSTTPISKSNQMQNSKAAWGAALNLDTVKN